MVQPILGYFGLQNLCKTVLDSSSESMHRSYSTSWGGRHWTRVRSEWCLNGTEGWAEGWGVQLELCLELCLDEAETAGQAEGRAVPLEQTSNGVKADVPAVRLEQCWGAAETEEQE